MSKLLHFPNLREARRQASLWIVRLDRGLSDAESIELRGWASSALNKRALREMAVLWKDMSVLNSLAELFPREAGANDATEMMQADVVPQHRLRGLAAAFAATVVIAVAVGVFMQQRGRPPVQAMIRSEAAPVAELIETPVGGSRTVALSDGSAVTLNTNTRLAVTFEPDHRDLQLARGEAHFRVAHDEHKPFRVFVGGRLVQAVGTEFNVRLRSDGQVDVTVTEGSVRVEAEPGQHDALRIVSAGQALVLDGRGNGAVESVDLADLERLLAWQRGVLIFQGEPLAEVLSEFDRYTDETLVIGDERLGNLRVGGYFRAGDVEALLDGLRENFRIVSARDSRGRIVLHSAP